MASVEHDRDRQHIACHDPARVLAEIDAKRRIIDALDVTEDRQIPAEAWLVGNEIKKAIALPYAGHPDYREEWRP